MKSMAELFEEFWSGFKLGLYIGQMDAGGRTISHFRTHPRRGDLGKSRF